MQYQPHPYQEAATTMIIQHPAVALWLEMGLGKTVSTLTALSDLLHDSLAVKRVLVIAPLRVAKDTWARETAKWDHLRYLSLSIVVGSEKQRLAALATPADIYIINRENVPWLVEHYKQKWPFDCVVIDEASSFKSNKAQRFRELKKVRPLINRMIELTGTPAPNNYLDIWPQIYLLDRGERLGKTIGSFRETYFKPGRRNGHIVYDWSLKPGAKDQIHKKLSDICYSMSAADYLKMPDRIDQVVSIALPKTARALYDELERDLVLQFDEGVIAATTAAVLSNKLMQIANGAGYDDRHNTQVLHDAKLDALEDLLEAANGSPVLCYYAYKHDLARIIERFPEARQLNTPDDISDWNAGRIPLLLAHPASAGHGLNLQDGGHHIIWFGLTWSLELYQQANARLHRQGQQHPVIVHHIVAADTIDEQVMEVLGRKEAGQSELLTAVKARIEKVRLT